MIVLMLTILVNVVIAIEKARDLSVLLASGGESGPPIWTVLPGLLLLAATFMAVAGVIGYGLLYALRKTGVQRLADIHHAPYRN
jgi:hypothetical protein